MIPQHCRQRHHAFVVRQYVDRQTPSVSVLCLMMRDDILIIFLYLFVVRPSTYSLVFLRFVCLCEPPNSDSFLSIICSPTDVLVFYHKFYFNLNILMFERSAFLFHLLRLDYALVRDFPFETFREVDLHYYAVSAKSSPSEVDSSYSIVLESLANLFVQYMTYSAFSSFVPFTLNCLLSHHARYCIIIIISNVP